MAETRDIVFPEAQISGLNGVEKFRVAETYEERHPGIRLQVSTELRSSGWLKLSSLDFDVRDIVSQRS